MAHGVRDDADVIKEQWTFNLQDLAELAVRLGAIPSVDRRGDVVYQNDFSGGMGGLTFAQTGGGGTHFYINEPSLTGGVALRTYSGEGPEGTAELYYNILVPTLGGMGFELTFLQESGLSYVILPFYIYDGDYLYNYTLKLDCVTHILSVYDSDGAWKSLGESSALASTTLFWQVVKLVVDAHNRSYLRFLLNDVEYDLSDYSPYVTADATNPVTIAGVVFVSVGIDPAIIYLDNVIVTVNE